jgi:tryptophanase
MAHITDKGGQIAELLYDEAYVVNSSHPFKGNMNIEKLEEVIKYHGPKNIPFIRMEASTNLIGGQPFSVQNMRDVRALADKYGIRVVLDCSLLGENAYLVLLREEEFKNSDMKTVMHAFTALADLCFSQHAKSVHRAVEVCVPIILK